MPAPLRVLILDGVAPRAELVALALSARGPVEVQRPEGALAGADALREGAFDAAVLGPVPWAGSGELVERARRSAPDARIVVLLPALTDDVARAAVALRVDDVVFDGPGAPLELAQRALPHPQGRVRGSRVDDAPTQQMAALRRPRADLLGGPDLGALLAAAGMAAFRARSDGALLRHSPDLADRLGAPPSPRLGAEEKDWAALVDDAARDGSVTRTLRVGDAGGRLVAITLRRAADGAFDGLLQDRRETEALWERLEQWGVGDGGPGGDVIALDERRARRVASTDPGAPAPGWRRELALASHDLQEPVRSMRIYAELLEEQLGPTLQGDARELVARGTEAARRAEAMLSDVVARAAGETVPEDEDADAGAVLAGVLANLQGALSESGGSVTHDPLPRVAVPPRELAQLLQNLVGNALKYRGDDPPRVHVAADRVGDRWRIAVADNGRGIDPGFLPRAFELFQRGPGAEDRPGTGIGLAVCKQVVEARGGTIEVDSTPGEGSTFTLTLPAPMPVMAKNANS